MKSWTLEKEVTLLDQAVILVSIRVQPVSGIWFPSSGTLWIFTYYFTLYCMCDRTFDYAWILCFGHILLLITTLMWIIYVNIYVPYLKIQNTLPKPILKQIQSNIDDLFRYVTCLLKLKSNLEANIVSNYISEHLHDKCQFWLTPKTYFLLNVEEYLFYRVFF